MTPGLSPLATATIAPPPDSSRGAGTTTAASVVSTPATRDESWIARSSSSDGGPLEKICTSGLSVACSKRSTAEPARRAPATKANVEPSASATSRASASSDARRRHMSVRAHIHAASTLTVHHGGRPRPRAAPCRPEGVLAAPTTVLCTAVRRAVPEGSSTMDEQHFARDEVEAAYRAFVAAGDAGDWDPWAHPHTVDCEWHECNYGIISGRDAIKAKINELMAPVPMMQFPVEW